MMPDLLERLLNTPLPVTEQFISPRDCIIYALGIGIGLDPTDPLDLPFVDETRLKVVPSMANILADNGFWLRDLDFGLDWQQMVHGEQAMIIHQPLPHSVTVRGTTRIVDVTDKGPGKGALLYIEREVSDVVSGERYATVFQTAFCRGDGGLGGTVRAPAPVWTRPDRQPDHAPELPTSGQQALIYRLSGDDNPLHCDPEVALEAGFPRPVLHGLATFGLAGHGLTKQLCGGCPERVKSMGGRFSAPVFPGDTLRVEIWETGVGSAVFQVRELSRDVIVITHGVFGYHHTRG